MSTTNEVHKMAQYKVEANGHIFGIYEAATPQRVRDLCVKDAGYKNETNMVVALERPSQLDASLA